MRYKSKLKLAAFVALFIFVNGMTKSIEAQVKIGVFADCQYCDCETAGNRYYRNSLKKLDKCISVFNDDKDIKFVLGLGDLIDRDFESFEKVNAILSKSNNKVYHITGNHDYSVDSDYLEEVPKQLNLKETYYTVELENWQFIFLDGNDITLNSNNKETVKQAEDMLAKLTSTNEPNNKEWNGGIGQTQISWLKTQLENAEKKKLNVVLFCHYPLLPLEAHALWNSTEVLSILNKHNCVKAWINGHNHAGDYAQQNGIHYITLKGMVDTETKGAYSILSFSQEKIEIEGFGREESKSLMLK